MNKSRRSSINFHKYLYFLFLHLFPLFPRQKRRWLLGWGGKGVEVIFSYFPNNDKAFRLVGWRVLFPQIFYRSCKWQTENASNSEEIYIRTCEYAGWSESILFANALTHYHIMPHFDALKIYTCGKHCEKRRNCLKQAISRFLTIFSTLYNTFFFFILNSL